MKYDAKEFKQYPEIMNKEQMRIACHISKRTALYLLQFDLIPHVSLMLIEHLEKCKKNTQERYLIVKFELPKSLILQAFPADESTKAVFHFESFMQL